MASPTNTDGDLETQTQDQPLEDSSTSDLSDTENAEDSSISEASEEEPSTFDVVMNAIDGEEEGDDESSSDEDDSDESDDKPEDGESEDSDDSSDDEFEDFSPEERAKLKKSTAERFDKLKTLYHESKEEVKTLTTQLEQANVDANHYKGFVNYLEQNRISDEEANQLFHIGALMKNDPLKALELITPYYNDLLQITGNVLPQDLQQQVQQGYITKQHALELSRLRATGQTNQAIAQEQQQYQQQQEVNRQSENVASMQTALADWEKQWSSSDPDYSTKKDRVLDRVELTLARAAKAGKLPQTVDEAIELANKAKADVEAELKKSNRKKAVNTVPGGSSNTSVPEPKDTRDVIRRALNQ